MSNPKDGHRKWHAAAVIVVGLLSLLTAPSPAVANSYHDFLCRIPYGPTQGPPRRMKASPSRPTGPSSTRAIAAQAAGRCTRR